MCAIVISIMFWVFKLLYMINPVDSETEFVNAIDVSYWRVIYYFSISAIFFAVLVLTFFCGIGINFFLHALVIV